MTLTGSPVAYGGNPQDRTGSLMTNDPYGFASCLWGKPPRPHWLTNDQ
ncbi:hypothetical protein [Nostoc sp. ChiVER01]|nr:hypothetical protein [Nostoc sp. ChiVER01]MDZ8226205.1 hypothetical protein [Nostoc sp. ChiVER01]